MNPRRRMQTQAVHGAFDYGGTMKQYYEAYDDRYLQVHEQALQWASDAPSGIVLDTIKENQIGCDAKLLEIGCGEGRDAVHLLRRELDVMATDISPEVIRYCRDRWPDMTKRD